MGDPAVKLRPEHMPAHSHNTFPSPPNHVHSIAPWYSHNPAFDSSLLYQSYGVERGPDGLCRPVPIGKTQSVRQDERGLYVKMQLDSSEFSKSIKKMMEKKFIEEFDRAILYGDGGNLEDIFPDVTSPIISANQMRSALGLMPIANKENTMAGTTKLKTPTENLERKDLVVALRLTGRSSDQDDLFHALALVQELEDNQTLYKATELTNDDVDVIGDTIKIDGKKVTGVLSDVVSTDPGYYHATIRLVVGGKLVEVPGNTYVTITEKPELGEDTLQVVRD